MMPATTPISKETSNFDIFYFSCFHCIVGNFSISELLFREKEGIELGS